MHKCYELLLFWCLSGGHKGALGSPQRPPRGALGERSQGRPGAGHWGIRGFPVGAPGDPFVANKFPESVGRVLGEGMPPGPTSQVCQQRKELLFYTLCRFFRGHCHEASYWFVCLVRFFVFWFWVLVWLGLWFVVGLWLLWLCCGCGCGCWFVVVVCGWFGFSVLVFRFWFVLPEKALARRVLLKDQELQFKASKTNKAKTAKKAYRDPGRAPRGAEGRKGSEKVPTLAPRGSRNPSKN